MRDALGERLFEASRAVLDVYCVHIGDRLGLYRALADGGALTADELAAAAGIHPRYAREWLLPTAMGEEDTAATGTVMRPDTFRGYALAAGFEDVEVLGIEHRFFRFYRLR
jgi:hypothetical protein